VRYLGCDCGWAEWLRSSAVAASGPKSERAAGNEAPIAAALGAIITYDGVTRTKTLETPQVIQL
jgi:hypothetical protein